MTVMIGKVKIVVPNEAAGSASPADYEGDAADPASIAAVENNG